MQAPAGAGTPTPEGAATGGSYWGPGGVSLQQQQQQKVGSNGGDGSGRGKGGQVEERKSGDVDGEYQRGDLEAQQVNYLLRYPNSIQVFV